MDVPPSRILLEAMMTAPEWMRLILRVLDEADAGRDALALIPIQTETHVPGVSA